MLNNFARKTVFNALENLKKGQLVLEEGSIRKLFGEKGKSVVNIEVLNPVFYQNVLKNGSIGAAESFIQGHWKTDNLTLLLRLLIRNNTIAQKFEGGFAFVTGMFRWCTHQLNRNSFNGSKKNIQRHYDLSNEFFALFLDKNMMYSSAIFPENSNNLDEASEYKLDVICKKLGLHSGDQVIEIGTGWGGFSLYAAEHYGCNIVTTTISTQQYEWAKKRIEEKKLTSKITLIQKDYRDLTGTYDKLVSIEMIEAVGHQYYPVFFETCHRLLNPEGQMLIQAITIQDQAFDRAKHEIDFIKRYIFPGSCIPSTTALLKAMTQSSDMKLFHLEDIGFDYAKTLYLWKERFLNQTDKIKQLGFDDHFIRMWEYYFSYCEAGFAEGYLGDVHLHCLKPFARSMPE
jgi:cyclopropane-fatty-acyl-phospholipid synthase